MMEDTRDWMDGMEYVLMDVIVALVGMENLGKLGKVVEVSNCQNPTQLNSTQL